MSTVTSSIEAAPKYEFTDFFVAFAVTCLVALAITSRRADLGNIVLAAAGGSAIGFIAQHVAPAAASSRIGWLFLGAINVALGITAALI